MQPKKFSQLLCAAQSDPVVVINVDKHHCDALVLLAGLDEAIHIPLNNFSFKKAQELHCFLNQMLLAAGVCQRDISRMRCAATTAGSDFPSILSNIWAYVVNPVLDGLAIHVSHSLSTISMLMMRYSRRNLAQRTLLIFGGVQQDHLHFFQSMWQVFIPQATLGSTYPTSSFPHTPPL